jgi:hypothetical protein
MQHLLSRARCDDHLMLDTAALWAAGRLAGSQEASDAVLIVVCRARHRGEPPY